MDVQIPVSVTTTGSVSTIALTRNTKQNSIDAELGARLRSAITAAAKDVNCRVIVLTGSHGVFCSGDDINAVQAARNGNIMEAPADPETGVYYYLDVCQAILDAPKPVIVGMDGATIGAGTEIACAGDYRLASDRVKIGSGLLKVGYAGTAALLPRVVGPARATELFLTSRLLDADQALHIGLVDRVVAASDFDSELDKLAHELAEAPTAAFAEFKRLREQSLWRPATEALHLQGQFHDRGHRVVEDGAEGIASFLERRPAVYTGR